MKLSKLTFKPIGLLALALFCYQSQLHANNSVQKCFQYQSAPSNIDSDDQIATFSDGSVKVKSSLQDPEQQVAVFANGKRCAIKGLSEVMYGVSSVSELISGNRRFVMIEEAGIATSPSAVHIVELTTGCGRYQKYQARHGSIKSIDSYSGQFIQTEYSDDADGTDSKQKTTLKLELNSRCELIPTGGYVDSK